MARSAAQRKTVEKGDAPYDFLMETKGGCRIEHATSPGKPWEFAHPDQDTWTLQDVFPSSPETFMYDMPATEKELRERQNPKKRKGPAAGGKGGAAVNFRLAQKQTKCGTIRRRKVTSQGNKEDSRRTTATMTTT
jgi:hypothetical protein